MIFKAASVIIKMIPNILIKGRTDNTFIQLFRYTFVGGIAFIADFCSLFVFTEIFAVHYLISAAIAFLLGLMTNYSLSIVWVFHKHTMNNKLYEFIIFAIIGILGLGLNEFFIWFFTERVGFYYLLSKIFSTVFVYLWNFFTRKFVLFR
jgi:putative flippase GtrA